MAQKLETHTRLEDADHRLHKEKELPAVEARQGRLGRRVLAVLVIGLVLAAIAWAFADMAGGDTGQTVSGSVDQGRIAAPAPKP